MTTAVAGEWQRKRACVVRRFGAGEDAALTRPVLLYFTGAKIDAIAADATTLQAFYQRYQQRADAYIIFSPTTAAPGIDMLGQRAKQVDALRKRCQLHMPCLLDGLENDVAFAYHVNTPRLFVIAKSGQDWAVRYASPYTVGNMATAMREAGRTLDDLLAEK